MRLDFREEEILKKLNLISDEGFLDNVELVDMVDQKVKDGQEYEKEIEALKSQESPEFREQNESLQTFVDLLSNLYQLFLNYLEGDLHAITVNVFKICLNNILRELKLTSISEIIEAKNQDKIISKLTHLLIQGLKHEDQVTITTGMSVKKAQSS